MPAILPGLKKLGHAIEYLSEDIVAAPDPVSRGRLEAILLLMKRNREVYGERHEDERGMGR